MRSALATLLAALCACAGPALAQPASESDYLAASKTFVGGTDDVVEFFKSYPEIVTRGLDGKWGALYLPAVGGFADRLAVACKAASVTIRTTPFHVFVMSRVNPKGDARFETVFTPISGNTFGRYTDADALLGYLGLTGEKATPELRYTALRANNGTATVIRQGENILVIQYEATRPAIYGRCE